MAGLNCRAGYAALSESTFTFRVSLNTLPTLAALVVDNLQRLTI